jgi:hypothetical protein
MSNAAVFARIGGLASDLQRSQRDLTNEAALAATTVYRASIRKAAPSGRIRNVGRNGAAVGAGYDVVGQVNPVAKIRARGPLQLLEWDTRPHRIVPKASRRLGGRRGISNRARRQSNYQYLFGGGGGYGSPALRMPDGKFRNVIDHPGSRGKAPWFIADEPARLAAAVTWTRAGRRLIAKNLTGG